jgi:hypothetical protein
MKQLIRSNSDTRFFFQNNDLNLINTNINNLKTIKNLQNKDEFFKKSNYFLNLRKPETKKI